MANTRLLKRFLRNLIGILLSFIVLIPCLLVVVNTFKNQKGATRMSLTFSGATLENAVNNYTKVIHDANILTGYLNSVFITSISTVIVLLIACMAAFICVRRKTPVMEFVTNYFIIGLALPSSIVAIHFLLDRIGLASGKGAYIGVILQYISNVSFPFFVYLGFIKGISPEIDEAAIIDGVSPLGLFFKIIFPLLRPVTITVMVTTVMTIWNDMQKPLYFLNDSKRATVVLGMYLFNGAHSSKWNLLFTDVVLIAMPVVILFLLLQKHIVSGISAGAVKG